MMSSSSSSSTWTPTTTTMTNTTKVPTTDGGNHTITDVEDDEKTSIMRRRRMTTMSMTTILERVIVDHLFPLQYILILPSALGIVLSGVGQAVHRYGDIWESPFHVRTSLSLLVLFVLWWLVLDRPSQPMLSRDVLQSRYYDWDRISSSFAAAEGKPTHRNETISMMGKTRRRRRKRWHDNDDDDDVNTSATTIATATAVTKTNHDHQIWKRRLYYNLISCLIVVALYALMILKPSKWKL